MSTGVASADAGAVHWVAGAPIPTAIGTRVVPGAEDKRFRSLARKCAAPWPQERRRRLDADLVPIAAFQCRRRITMLPYTLTRINVSVCGTWTIFGLCPSLKVWR